MLRVFSEGSLHLEDAVAKRILLFPKNAESFILFCFEDPLFLRMFWGPSSFFIRMEAAQKRGMHPLFYGLRLQGS